MVRIIVFKEGTGMWKRMGESKQRDDRDGEGELRGTKETGETMREGFCLCLNHERTVWCL